MRKILQEQALKQKFRHFLQEAIEFERRKQFLGWVISFAIFFALYVHYLDLASPLVPYMDSVRVIVQLNDLLSGATSLTDLWHQANSVGILYQLMTLAEWVFWGLDSRITVVLTAVVWAVLFGLYAKAWPKLQNISRATTFGMFAVQLLVGFYIFSPAGWEIWLLDLGLSQTLKNLIIAIYIYKLSQINYRTNSASQLFLTGIVGALIVLLASYNWSYSFTAAAVSVVVICVWRESIKLSKGLLIVLPILFAQLLFVKVSGGAGLDSKAVTLGTGDAAIVFLKALLYGASSIFVGGETLDVLHISSIVLMTAGGVFIIAIFVIFLLWNMAVQLNRNGVFFAGLGVFGLCTLASIALARGGQGYNFAASPRYFMDYQFIFIGFLGLAANILLFSQRERQSISKAVSHKIQLVAGFSVVIFGGMAIAGHAATYIIEYKKAPYRALAYKAQSDVYLSGEANEINAKLLQTDIATLSKALPISYQFSLASLRNFSGGCNLKEALMIGDAFGLEGTGRWMGKEAVVILGACPEVFQIEGYLPPNVLKRTLTISLDGETYKKELQPGEGFTIPVNQRTNRHVVRIRLKVDRTHKPSMFGSSDSRELGVFLTKITP